MLYLLAAILTSSAIVITFKVYEKWKIDTIVAITINYLVASTLGFWLCSETSSPVMAMEQSWFPVSVLSGIMLLAVFFVYASSTQKAGVAITSVSGKMSVVFPVMLGLMWYNESARWYKIIGIIIALMAFWMTFIKKNDKQARKLNLLLPLLLFVGNGINDSLLKIAEGEYINNDFVFFLSTAFAVSFITSIIILTIKSIISKQFPAWKSILAGIFLGLLNWYSTYFFLIGLHHFDVSVFVPVFNVSIVVTGALAGFFIFREKLRLINWIGIALAVCAIILMTI